MEKIMTRLFMLAALCCLLAVPAAKGEPVPVVTDALVIAPGRKAGRSPVWVDPVEHAWVVGTWTAPHEGDEVTRPDGKVVRWERTNFDDKGSLNHPALRNGYALVTVESPTERVVMLEAAGHSTVRVNGQPRAGDPYNYGFVRVPILLHEGTNELLFRVGRGRLRVSFAEPPAEVFFLNADDTRPDLIDVTQPPGPVGVVVVNASLQWTTVAVHTQQADVNASEDFVSHASFEFAPLSVRKLPLELPPPVLVDGSEVQYEIALEAEERTVAEPRKISLRVRSPTERHDRTFISTIDGSTQYYTVVPPTKPIENPALVLTLHGASVEARGQAAAYAPKDWAAIIAPTNRRPFGFDWEDWGRLDAMEVLDLATQSLSPDPARIYLTGHSMGGHGTWNVGVLFPDRFAAIAPSAGWVSFWSYTGARNFDDESSVEAIMRRAVAPSDTLSLIENLKQDGVYILHGDADDNVPVALARTMRTKLAEFHRDFSYYEQPGAGHWWGNRCVDWGPIFSFFKWHTIPEAARATKFAFVTPDPGVSDRCYWLRVIQQERSGVPSRVEASAGTDGVTLKTENVKRIAIDLGVLAEGEKPTIGGPSEDAPETPVVVRIDEAVLEVPRADASGVVYAGRTVEGSWELASFDPAQKNPTRTGPFKNAYRNRMVFVVGSDAWSLAKARFDAETFWYRGNGDVDIFRAHILTREMIADRNVIAYGPAAFNTVQRLLELDDSPIGIEPGGVGVGDQEIVIGEDLALLAVMPGATDATLVAVVAGTGVAGERLCDQVPVFVSGIGYPDWTVLSSEMLIGGFDGVVGAGFFDAKWQYDSAQSAWSAKRP
jgi:pimeloyl-ACP methyl ester carboxylesterase